MVMLPENMFINLLDTDLQERILNRKELDIDMKNAMETLLQEGPTSLKNNLEDWKIEEVAKMYHDHKTAGHPGELETYNLI